MPLQKVSNIVCEVLSKEKHASHAPVLQSPNNSPEALQILSLSLPYCQMWVKNSPNGLHLATCNLDDKDTFVYMGRSLECEDKDLTFPTPGVFPRIQVLFNNAFQSEMITLK